MGRRRKVVALYPDSFAGTRDLGTSYDHLGRADDAARAWDRALALRDSDDVRASLAFLLVKEGRRPQALQHLGVLAEHGTQRPEVWSSIARLSYETGDLKAVVDSLIAETAEGVVDSVEPVRSGRR